MLAMICEFCIAIGISGGIRSHQTNRDPLSRGCFRELKLDTVSTRCLSNYLL